jgi:steroid delta-isomerase-like uncharacterized protein
MSKKNVDALRNAHECWNRRDFDGTLREVADHCVYVDHARGQTINGKHAFRQYVESWAKAMTDGKITSPHYHDAGNQVIVEFNAEGTNDGSLAGFPPSHRPVSFSFCEIWTFDKDGRMTSGGCYYDLYTILAQIGQAKPLSRAA